jgi:hypothetical protein
VIIWISEAKSSPKRKNELRMQINGKSNDTNSADERKSL